MTSLECLYIFSFSFFNCELKIFFWKIVEYPSWFFTFFWDDSKISYIFKQFVFKIKKAQRNRKINKIKMQFIKIQNGPQKCILFSLLFYKDQQENKKKMYYQSLLVKTIHGNGQ